MRKTDRIKSLMEALDSLSFDELKEKFRDLHGFSPGVTSSPALRRRITYRLQEIQYGGVSQEDRKRLVAIADSDPLSNLSRRGQPPLLVKGVRLSREWKGERVEVMANGNGKFDYNGKEYNSLSAVAREITGTRWNGKLFFGVK